MKRGSGRGGLSKRFTRKKHGALICRIIPKSIQGDEARVDVLLQKHADSRGEDSYGFVSFLESAGKEPPTDDTIQFFLRKNFVSQCGSPVEWASCPAAPPLIPVSSLELQGIHYWIFLLPRCHNNWKAQPAAKFPFLKYNNEHVDMNLQSFTAESGLVWVDFTSFTEECGNQLVLRYKDKIACKFGVQCKNMKTCNFLHFDPACAPQPRPTNTVIEQQIVQLLLNTSATIGARIIEKINTDSLSLVQNAGKGKICDLLQDPQLHGTIQIDYSSCQFQLKITNTSTVPLEYSIQIQSNADIIEATLQCECGTFKSLPKGESVSILGQLGIKQIYCMKDLPVVNVKYKTNDLAHTMQVRIPALLYRFCKLPEGFNPNGESSVVKESIMRYYRLLSSAKSDNFVIDMPLEETYCKEQWLERLQNCSLPICTPFTEQNMEYLSMVAVLGNTAIIIFMNFLEDGTTQKRTLRVIAHFVDENLYFTFKEALIILSSKNPGFDGSDLLA